MNLPKFSLPKSVPREQTAFDPHLALIHITAFVTGCAALTEWVWAVLFCIEATGRVGWHVDWANGNADNPRAWAWGADFAANIPVLFALLLATVPIVLWSMIWLPFYQKSKGAGKARRSTIALAGILANALVILSGTIVMNGNRQEHVRATLVTEQSSQQARAGLQALAASKKAELDDIAVPTSQRPTYQQQACRVGAPAWSARVATARAQADYQLPAIERALADATHCDDLRKEYRSALEQVYTAPVAAKSAAVVQDTYGAGMNDFAQYAMVYRPPFVALICTLIGIWGAWWLIGAWERYLDAQPQPASDAFQIEDHSMDAKLAVDPEGPRMGKMVDAETGEELVPVRGARPHFRKKGPKKNGRQEATLETSAPALPDDKPAVMSGTDPRSAVRAEANEADARSEDARVVVEMADGRNELETAAGNDLLREDAVSDHATEHVVGEDHDRNRDADPDAVSASRLAESETLNEQQEDGLADSDSVSYSAQDHEPSDAGSRGEDEGRDGAVVEATISEPPADELGGGDRVADDQAQPAPVDTDPLNALSDEELAQRLAEDRPMILSDEQYDRLEAKGLIIDGEFVSQENQEVIEQSDQALVYPALTGPKKVVEEAA